MTAPTTRIAQPIGEVVLSVALLGAGGVLLGLLLPAAAQWLLALPWIPFEGPLQLVGRVDAALPGWVLPLVGGVAGVLLAAVGAGQEPVIEVGDRDLVVRRGQQRTRVARSQVGEVLVDGRHLVVRDPADVELVHQSVSGDRARLREALRRHRWPGADQPH